MRRHSTTAIRTCLGYRAPPSARTSTSSCLAVVGRGFLRATTCGRSVSRTSESSSRQAISVACGIGIDILACHATTIRTATFRCWRRCSSFPQGSLPTAARFASTARASQRNSSCTRARCFTLAQTRCDGMNRSNGGVSQRIAVMICERGSSSWRWARSIHRRCPV